MAFENPFKNLSKPQIYGIIGGSVLLGGFFEYRHHKATGSWNPFSKTVTAADGSQIDPVTGLAISQDNAIDPITNLPYLQEAEQYGSVQAAEASVSSYGQSSPSGTGTSTGFGTSGDGSSNQVGTPGPGNYPNDAAWVQAATAGLEQIEYDATTVSNALGAYIGGQQLTPDQANLVRVARAEFGTPPGNEPVILAPVTQPGPTGDPGGKNGPPSVSDGHVIKAEPNDATVGWTGTNAVKYDVAITGPGKINGQKNTVSTPQADYSGLEPGHSYTVTITPYNSSGKPGSDGHIDLKTPPVSTAKVA